MTAYGNVPSTDGVPMPQMRLRPSLFSRISPAIADMSSISAFISVDMTAKSDDRNNYHKGATPVEKQRRPEVLFDVGGKVDDCRLR